MKRQQKLYCLIFLLLVCLPITACNGSTPGNIAPSVNVEATVAAQVQATMVANDGALAEPAANNNVQPAADTAVTDPNPPLALPFTDNFDTGLSNAWRVVSGTPIIADGKLGSAREKDVFLEIGNNQLTDYIVEFTVSGDEHGWGGYFSSLDVTLSATLKAHIRAADTVGRVEWLAFENNEWSEISEVEFQDNFEDNFRVIISGSQYTVYLNGQILSELIYGASSSGDPLLISIHGDNIKLDNFRLE